MISMLLYGVLGVALQVSGVGMLERPWEFFSILTIVIAIDIWGLNNV